jgi:hypothetical protein
LIVLIAKTHTHPHVRAHIRGSDFKILYFFKNYIG